MLGGGAGENTANDQGDDDDDDAGRTMPVAIRLKCGYSPSAMMNMHTHVKQECHASFCPLQPS